MSTPVWTQDIIRTWNSRTHSVFVLHGNIHDLHAFSQGTVPAFVNLKTYLVGKIFANRRMTLFFDLADGLSFATQEMQGEFVEWLSSYSQATGVPDKLPSKLADVIAMIRAYTRYLEGRDDVEKDGRAGVTLVVDFADKIIPAPSNMHGDEEKRAEVALLKFAASHSQADAGIFLLAESALALSESLSQSPYVRQVAINMPDEEERAEFLASEHLRARLGGKSFEEWAGRSAEDVASRTAGLTLRRLEHLVAHTRESGGTLTLETIASGKKRLIEEFCAGLVTFKEANPKRNLDNVANHNAAKEKLRGIARLVREGKTRSLEKGILIPGRIGSGKSFLVSCFSSECGMPTLEMGNFRSQWVGETEKQLTKILITIEALGPVVVVIDEADAVLGNSRDSGSNDGGVSNRTFAKLANHIGKDEIRGREIWIAMTSRPDLLAIDMKRQGRFGLCLPLFGSQSVEETRNLFEVVAKTMGIVLGTETLQAACDAFGGRSITGSDVESMLNRALEAAELDGKETPEPAHIKDATSNFLDPLDPDLLRLQELAAVLACTDKRLLPEDYKDADRSVLRAEMERLKF